MADFDEGLAVGLLLGRKKGSGGYRSDVFHDILENSEGWTDIPIDDKFKFTLSLWYTQRPDVYDAEYVFNGYADGDGTRYMTGRVRKNIYVCVTLWENGEAVYSIIGYAGEPGGTADANATFSHTDEDGVSRTYHYYSEVKEPVKGTMRFTSGSFTIPDDFVNSYINTPYKFTSHIKHYQPVRLPPSGEYAKEIKLTGEEDTEYTVSYVPARIYPSYPGTFSDLSEEELFAKWKEAVIAIYASKGFAFREAMLMEPDV